jgi:hypothetical protein
VSHIAAGNSMEIGAEFSKWRRGSAGVCGEEGIRVPVTSLVVMSSDVPGPAQSREPSQAGPI